MLAQVPTSMVVTCSQIDLSLRIPILRYGPKHEIRPQEAHFRAYFNASYLVFGNRYSFFSLFRDERLGKYLQLLVNKFFHTGPPGGAMAIVYFLVMSH